MDENREAPMELALRLAREALSEGEVPVGCVILDREGKRIGSGRNRRESRGDATAHAEMEAIREACENRKDWRLNDCTLYVTLEPCPMCAGAIMNARIPTLVYGAKEKITGSCGSVLDLFCENYPNSTRIYPGVLAEESEQLMKEFFRKKRREELD